jgi:hypothetical protein
MGEREGGQGKVEQSWTLSRPHMGTGSSSIYSRFKFDCDDCRSWCHKVVIMVVQRNYDGDNSWTLSRPHKGTGSSSIYININSVATV